VGQRVTVCDTDFSQHTVKVAMISRRKALLASVAMLVCAPSQTLAFSRGSYFGTVLLASAYGVVGDGVTDNLSALTSLATAAKAITGLVAIYLPQGTICYSSNKWFFGLLNVNLIGAAGITTLQCTNTSNNNADLTQPINTGSPLQTNFSTFTGGWNYTNGFLFNTVAAGATSISLVNSGDVSNFAAGNRILLYGYEQDVPTSFPPGARYFDYCTIQSIVGSTLFLTGPVKNSYNSQWADVPGLIPAGVSTLALNSGAPRALLLDASYYTFPSFVGLYNLHFASSPNLAMSGQLTIPADTLYVQNCSADYSFFSSMNRIATFSGCSAPYSEIDKLCSNVTLNSCKIGFGVSNGYLSGAYSTDSFTVNGCSINGNVNVCPKNFSISNTNIDYNNGDSETGSITVQPGQFPMSAYAAKALTLNNSISASNAHLEGLDIISQFTVNGVSGNNILLTFGSWLFSDTNATIYRRCGAGTIIQKSDGTKTGTVQDITFNGTNFTIIINPSGGVPVANETWQFRSIQNFSNLGGHSVLDGNAFATFGDTTVNATFANL
jgi:hypothetical protein